MNKRNAGREKAKRERDPRRREKTEMRADRLLGSCRGGSGSAAPAGLLPHHTAAGPPLSLLPAAVTGISQDHPTLPETQPEKDGDLMNLIQPVCPRLGGKVVLVP